VLEGENVICFAKDFTEDPTSNNHVMRLFARRNRVLWLNSVGTRSPELASGRDLAKIARKVRGFAQGPVRMAENLWVYTPLVLPFPHARAAVAVNQRIVRATLASLRRRLGMDSYQLWAFIPTALPYLGMPGERLAVYYCTDEWSRFSYVDGAKIADMEQTLCRRADLVFASARSLWERRRALNPETHLAPHGVDHAHFARALADETRPPDALADCRGPIVGFFGLVHDWIDLGLLAHVAQRRPDWTIAIVGETRVDVSSLKRLPNVRLLGRQRYEELPRYCKAFWVGVIPFVINELTHNVNPIKMREYLSAGLPVVSTDLPEVRAHAQWCRIARTPDEFLAACERAIHADTPEERRRRCEAMAAETWEVRVGELGRMVRNALDRREAA